MGKVAGDGSVKALFDSSPPPIDSIVEIYKMYVGNAEAVVQRRHGVNTFFLSVNTLLMTGIAVLVEFGTDQRLGSAGMIVFASTGALLSIVWNRLIRLYGAQRTSMFEVVNALEDHLGVRPYQVEWQHFRSARPEKPQTFTRTESSVPRILMAFYAVVAVVAGVWVFVSR